MVIETKKMDFKRRPFFEYNRVLLILTVVLGVALVVIIRGSSWPLLVDNELMRSLFYQSENSDHTIYNIGISYVAAYIFYVIQVYVPEQKRTKNAILSTKLDVWNLLRQSTIFIEAWKRYTVRDKEKGAITKTNIGLLYFEDSMGNVIEVTRKKLEETLFRILEEYKKVKNNTDFAYADMSLKELILDMDFADQAKEMFDVLLSAELLGKTDNTTILETYSEQTLLEYQLRIMKLAMIYNIADAVKLWETTDADKILAYHDIMAQNHKMIEENMEYFTKLHDSYGKPIDKG